MPYFYKGVLKATILITAFVFIVSPEVSIGGELRLSVVSPMTRIFNGTPVEEQNKTIEFWTAGNEYESAQIAINSSDEITINSIEISDLHNSKTRKTISKEHCEIKVPEYVYVEWNTRATPKEELDGRAPEWYPDPLSEFSPLKFKGSRSLWVNCYIPAGTSAGTYKGVLSVTTNKQKYELAIISNVWGFSIPSKSTFHVSNWLHTSQLIKQYRVKPGSENYWYLVNLVAEDMKKHRQNVIFTRLNIIKTIIRSDGGYDFDFDAYERWVKIFLDHEFNVIEGGPLLHPKSFQIYKNGKKIKFNKKRLSKFLASNEGQELTKALLGALHKKNIELGINDKYLQHVGDEAKKEERKLYRQLVGIVHDKMSGVPVIDATELANHMRHGMMDIAVTNLSEEEALKDNEYISKWGLWWYTAAFKPRGKMPNRFIDYPLIKLRMLPLLAWRYGVSGYLHYAYNWWHLPSNESPWNQTQYKNYAAGDGWIVYPPKDKKLQAPISSLRWETFRDGLEDYEYIRLLEKGIDKLNLITNDSPGYTVARQMIDKGSNIIKSLQKSIINKNAYSKSHMNIKSIRFLLGEWLHDYAMQAR